MARFALAALTALVLVTSSPARGQTPPVVYVYTAVDAIELTAAAAGGVPRG
jgi:hypothetical protein